jgi:phosphopantetheinyl transferase (holo-ACP synthase)
MIPHPSLFNFSNVLLMVSFLQLHGDAKAAASKAGVKETTVSISHSDAQVIAVAISSF